jgi:hypothetical protein
MMQSDCDKLLDRATREVAEQTWRGPAMKAGSIMVLLGWQRRDLAAYLVPASEIRKLFHTLRGAGKSK